MLRFMRMPWRGPRRWMQHLAIRVQHPCFEPLLDQPQQCSVIEALCQHPDHPLVIDVVEEASDIRFDHPGASPKLARDRPCVYRVQGPHLWPLSIATAQKILLVEGGEEARDRQRQQLILDGRYPQRSQLAVLFGDIVPSDPCGSVALPLQSLHQWPDVRFQVLLVRVRAHLIDAVGGLLADITPAVLEQLLIEPPVEVANPILRVAFGLLCYALQGGVPGVSEPSCPVHVSCAGCASMSARCLSRNVAIPARLQNRT